MRKMKILHLLIIVILVTSLITVSQSVFAQQTAKEILQQRDDAKKTGLVYNGTTLMVTPEINKTEFKTGEKFSVTQHLINMGNNVASIIHGDPLFEIKVLDGNSNVSFIWPDAIVDVGITETLEPGMSTSGRVISGNGAFPEIALDKLGNYTIYSIANINSEGMPAHTESIWSQPLKISILPENYPSQVNSTNSISTIPSSILHSPVPTLSPPENQSVVDAALTVPELRDWSHDWKYVGMGFGSNNKAASGDFEWQYASVVLKAPSGSALFPCNSDWWATIVIDMTTMKVVQANYPTMESHSCQVITLGGSLSGRIKLSSNVTNIESPLKQFKSGVALKDITCAPDLQLIVKAKSRSPACVKPDDISKLVERGWADKPNSLQEKLDFANVCLGMNDACRHRFDAQNNDPFGITALIIYHPPLSCIGPVSNVTMNSCAPNTFYLKINSNSTAYLIGYNICDEDSCTIKNDLSVLLPINVLLKPDYQMIGLPVNLQWKYGDTVHIQLEVSPNDDNKTASLVDLGNSTIVP